MNVTAPIPVPEPDITPARLFERAIALGGLLREQQEEADERGTYSAEVHEAYLRPFGLALSMTDAAETILHGVADQYMAYCRRWAGAAGGGDAVPEFTVRSDEERQPVGTVFP